MDAKNLIAKYGESVIKSIKKYRPEILNEVLADLNEVKSPFSNDMLK